MLRLWTLWCKWNLADYFRLVCEHTRAWFISLVNQRSILSLSFLIRFSTASFCSYSHIDGLVLHNQLPRTSNIISDQAYVQKIHSCHKYKGRCIYTVNNRCKRDKHSCLFLLYVERNKRTPCLDKILQHGQCSAYIHEYTPMTIGKLFILPCFLIHFQKKFYVKCLFFLQDRSLSLIPLCQVTFLASLREDGFRQESA